MGGASYPGSVFSLTDHEVYVLTAAHEGRANGQIATWLMPATLVPDAPRLVAAISPLNYTHDLIAGSSRFIVQMLAQGQHELVPRFGLYSGRDRDKFEGVPLDGDLDGIPLLAGVCGWMDCRIVDALNSGDRMIYLADVVNQRIFPDRLPLRKNEAFAAQPADILERLEAKHRNDGERDKTYIKRFR